MKKNKILKEEDFNLGLMSGIFVMLVLILIIAFIKGL